MLGTSYTSIPLEIDYIVQCPSGIERYIQGRGYLTFEITPAEPDVNFHGSYEICCLESSNGRPLNRILALLLKRPGFEDYCLEELSCRL